MSTNFENIAGGGTDFRAWAQPGWSLPKWQLDGYSYKGGPLGEYPKCPKCMQVVNKCKRCSQPSCTGCSYGCAPTCRSPQGCPMDRSYPYNAYYRGYYNYKPYGQHFYHYPYRRYTRPYYSFDPPTGFYTHYGNYYYNIPPNY